MKTLNIKNLIRKSYLKNLRVPGSAKMDDRILGDAFATMEESTKQPAATNQPNIQVMKISPTLSALRFETTHFFVVQSHIQTANAIVW